MRDFVNEKARLLQPSGIRKFFDIVRETEGAISLGVGEPDFVTPWSVRSAAIASLQRFKDSVKEVAAGYECGITFEKFQDIKEGDIIEAFVMEQIEV